MEPIKAKSTVLAGWKGGGVAEGGGRFRSSANTSLVLPRIRREREPKLVVVFLLDDILVVLSERVVHRYVRVGGVVVHDDERLAVGRNLDGGDVAVPG